MANIRPRYEVKDISDQEFERTVYDKDDNGVLVRKTVKENMGYMVYFPTGASMHVRTKEELNRLGFNTPAELIDLENGEVVGSTGQHSLERLSEQKTRRGQRNQLPSEQDGD